MPEALVPAVQLPDGSVVELELPPYSPWPKIDQLPEVEQHRISHRALLLTCAANYPQKFPVLNNNHLRSIDDALGSIDDALAKWVTK